MNTSSLTFTTSNWGTAQTVTVSAGEDADAADDTATLRHTASGGDYASETADVSVTVDDDESVGLVLSKTSINPGEGSSESYTVKLSSEPTATVTVAITGSQSSTDLSLNTTSLTFTTSNWGTAQTVTVSAGEDADATDDTATLRHTASGWRLRERDGGRIGDGRRRRVRGLVLVLSKTSINPGEGSSESYTVKLSSEPTAQVTVAITGHSRDRPESEHVEPDVHDVELGYGADGDGERGRGRRRGGRRRRRFGTRPPGGDYASETADVSVTVDDDESVGLVLSKTSINPGEGSSESYTVKLSSEPTATVTVAITGSRRVRTCR